MIDNNIIKAAEAQALQSGYDQAIFIGKNKKYNFVRTTATKNMRQDKIKAIIKLVYKDNMLSTKMVAV